jgi:glutamine synthetase
MQLVVFDGDGYSEERHREAEKRRLPDLRTTVDTLPVVASDEVVPLVESYGVLTKRATPSRLWRSISSGTA